jgi:thymidine kinase
MEKNTGYLSICGGCMFSGKTSWLMQQYKTYKYIGKNICVVNYDADKRYHQELLSTHDKQMIPCIQAHLLEDVIVDLMKADVILINEGQFFEDLYEVCINMVEKWKKRVHIAALDGDFKQEVFGDVLKLIPKCDDYIKLHALCAHCKDGTKAPFSHRLSEESQQISIGVTNYIPLCRKCYSKENNKKDVINNYRITLQLNDV